MAKIRDITGRRFGRLTVLGLAQGRTKGRETRWRCKCDCGKEKVIPRGSLTEEHSRSCGCIHRCANGEAKNGKQTTEYLSWAGMKSRCYLKTDRKYVDYGGRGIEVCERWKNSYINFLKDVGRRPSPQHSLDRIDNNGNYEPKNVRWATKKVQQSNRRKPKNNRWVYAARHAYKIVRVFEDVIADYCGSKYAVAVESCTSALQLACTHLQVQEVEIPKFTYVGVAQAVLNAGGRVKFSDEDWLGSYQLKPYPIYDNARLFTSNMYVHGSLMCVSFHWAKHLPIGRGGAILCDDAKIATALRRARFDGRSEHVPPKEDKFTRGWHMYLTPPQAAQGLMLMASIQANNPPLANSDYPDLSKQAVFK